jgi:signal transduction histidine kinase/ActR/RegA family two-component response regulator
MRVRHALLARQLARHLGTSSVPPELAGFVQAVEDAYREHDADRAMLERSLELSSQELMLATSEMRTVLQAMPDLIFRLDARGTILGCQPGRPDDVYGRPAELLGKRIQEVPVKEVASKLGEALRTARETRALVTTEYRLELHGVRQWYEARLVPLLDDEIIMLVRNVTERKRMEDERVRTSRLDSMTVLAGGIAHDFNNILAAIIGNLSFARTTQRQELVQGVLGDVEAAAIRAQKLVAQLAAFSRGGVPIRRVVTISPLLRESAEFALRGSNVTCEFTIADDLWPVNADEGQIGQVVDNLVINAKQAMPEGGRLLLRAENVAVDGRDPAAAQAGRPGRYVRIVVRDHGVGIPKRFLPRIFDPYFTTKETGTGLGLATTYAIVKRHDGHIAVESLVGLGTTFTIHLPASDEQPTAAPARRPAAARSGRGHLLLMDDEEMILDGTGRMLQHLGYSVRLARNGEEAVALYRGARDQGRPFDAVIMDLTIPAGMGGKEAVQVLRALDPDVTAIVSSGYSDEPIMAEYAQHGFDGVLAKPYTMRELVDVLEQVLSPLQVRAG